MTIPQTPKYQSAIGQAVAIWQSGKSIPLVLFRELKEQGYDPVTLARHYSH
jgi:hypothetical protein